MFLFAYVSTKVQENVPVNIFGGVGGGMLIFGLGHIVVQEDFSDCH